MFWENSTPRETTWAHSRTPLIQINCDGEPSGYAENPDIWNFFFENRLYWQLEDEKKSTNGCFKLHIYLRKNKTLIHHSLYIFDNWEQNYKLYKVVVELQ